jgi:O-antigen/teichoic acid export membrane protein
MTQESNGTRGLRWIKLLAISLVAQLGVQALAFLAGILVIRQLSTGEYALYTLANTTLGTMTLLADSGVAAGVTARAGQIWTDSQRLASVIGIGLQLRRKFATGSLAVVIPILFYLLHDHGASWIAATCVVVALLPAFFTALSGSLLEIPLKLRREVVPLQQVQLASNAIRLALLVVALALLPLAALAMACNAVGQIWANVRMRRLLPDVVGAPALPDPSDREALIGVVKRLLPGTVYYAFFGQITLWIVSAFGSTQSIAQVGALSRLAMALTVFSAVIGTLIVPRFVTLPADHRLLRARFLQIEVGVFLLGAVVVVAVWSFPRQALLILGHGYADLGSEVVLMAAGACLNLVAATLYALDNARGKIPAPYVYPVTGIAMTIVLAATLDVTTVAGVLIFNLLLQLSSIIVGNLVFFLMRDRISVK